MKYIFISDFNPITNDDIKLLETPNTFVLGCSHVDEIKILPDSTTSYEDREKMVSSLKLENTLVSEYKEDDRFDIGTTIIVPASHLEKIVDNHSISHIVVLKEVGKEITNDIKNIVLSKSYYSGSKQSMEIRNGYTLHTVKEVLDYIADNKLYFLKHIASMINEHRYRHSVSVAKTAYDIALANSLDYESAYLAGLLHDCCKDYKDEEALLIMEEYYKEYLPCPSYAYHQFISSYLAKTVYRQKTTVLDAIQFHCSGKKEMSAFAKCLFAADKCEPTRQFETKKMREMCLADIDTGFVEVLEELKEYYERKNIDYLDYYLSKEMYQYYLKKE